MASGAIFGGLGVDVGLGPLGGADQLHSSPDGSSPARGLSKHREQGQSRARAGQGLEAPEDLSGRARGGCRSP
jgi:hypothetical protein